MKVCDRCSKKDNLKTIQFEGKSYDVCGNCLNKIETFLNTQEKKGLFGLFGG